jgi:hypothetical protein
MSEIFKQFSQTLYQIFIICITILRARNKFRGTIDYVPNDNFKDYELL